MALGIFNLMPPHEFHELELRVFFHHPLVHGAPQGDRCSSGGEPSVWRHVRDVTIAKGLLAGLWAQTGHHSHTHTHTPTSTHPLQYAYKFTVHLQTHILTQNTSPREKQLQGSEVVSRAPSQCERISIINTQGSA